MRRLRFVLPLLASAVLQAVIIDRIAVVSGDSIIKDSDIERDIRVTDLLNLAPLNFTAAARKASAGRLLDQIYIREEIRAGDYSRASKEEADRQFDTLVRRQFGDQAHFSAQLQKYGVREEELRAQFRWQLTVLRFIDLRFKPAAYVTDEEITDYFHKNTSQLRTQYPGKTTLEELRPEVTNVLVEEKTNQLFFTWLDEQRKSTRPQYHEEGLQCLAEGVCC